MTGIVCVVSLLAIRHGSTPAYVVAGLLNVAALYVWWVL